MRSMMRTEGVSSAMAGTHRSQQSREKRQSRRRMGGPFFYGISKNKKMEKIEKMTRIEIDISRFQ